MITSHGRPLIDSRVTGQNHLVFIHDAWRPTPRLTITPGVALNYGRQNDESGAAVIEILRPTPHLSAVWNATGDGKQETFRDFLIRMVRSGRFAAGKVKTIYDDFYR